jgi:hypothetical protein
VAAEVETMREAPAEQLGDERQQAERKPR